MKALAISVVRVELLHPRARGRMAGMIVNQRSYYREKKEVLDWFHVKCQRWYERRITWRDTGQIMIFLPRFKFQVFSHGLCFFFRLNSAPFCNFLFRVRLWSNLLLETSRILKDSFDISTEIVHIAEHFSVHEIYLIFIDSKQFSNENHRWSSRWKSRSLIN